MEWRLAPNVRAAKTSRVRLPARNSPRQSRSRRVSGLGLRFSSGDRGEGWSWLVIETETLPLHLDDASFCLRLAGDAVDGGKIRDIDGNSEEVPGRRTTCEITTASLESWLADKDGADGSAQGRCHGRMADFAGAGSCGPRGSTRL